MLGPEQAHKKARADLSVLLHICCAPTMLFLGGLDVTLAVRPARFQRRTLRQQGRKGGFSLSDVSTGIGELETQLANLFERLECGVNLALQGEEPLSRIAPVGARQTRRARQPASHSEHGADHQPESTRPKK